MMPGLVIVCVVRPRYSLFASLTPTGCANSDFSLKPKVTLGTTVVSIVRPKAPAKDLDYTNVSLRDP